MTDVRIGGKPFYGFDLGVLLLNNTTPRPIGDIGNAYTWDFPVYYKVVESAMALRVVEQGAEGLLPDFIEAAQELERIGVKAITTSCGFLALFQEEMASAVSVPVATSSIMQVPQALHTLGRDRRVCVLTINGETLTPQHFAAAGVSEADLERVTVVGLEHSTSLYPALIQEAGFMDIDVSRRDMVEAAQAALKKDDSIGAFVFECTNMPPYGAAVREATGLPVWDVVTLGRWMRNAVATTPR